MLNCETFHLPTRTTIAGEKEKKDERMKGKEQEQEEKYENCKDASSRSSGRHWSLYSTCIGPQLYHLLRDGK